MIRQDFRVDEWRNNWNDQGKRKITHDRWLGGSKKSKKKYMLLGR